MTHEKVNLVDQVERKLHRAWRKERRFYHIRGLAQLAVWLVALILLDFLVDWAFTPPFWGRAILLTINLVVLVVAFRRGWHRHLRPYDAVRVALEVENRHPELKSLLVSYVQVGRGASQDASASPVLIAAMRREALDVTRPMDFREIISYLQLRRILGLSVAVVIFFAAISINWSGFFSTLLARMTGAQVRYPTRTKILAVTPGNTTVKQGQTISLSANVSGVIPRRGALEVKLLSAGEQPGPGKKVEAGRWERLVANQTALDTFGYTFPEVFQTFEYRFHLGDDVSNVYSVKVVPAPHIVASKVRLKFPAYTKLPARTVDTLSFEVPEGTELEWELKLDRPLARAQMLRPKVRPAEFANGVTLPASASAPASQPAEEALPLTVEAGGLVVRGATRADEPFSYRFRWTEAEYGYVYDEDVRNDCQVLADQPPEVEIVFPALDEKGTVRKTLELGFRARDDYLVDCARIVYTVNAGEEKTRVVELTPGREVEKVASWSLKESIPDIKEGDVIVYFVEVLDNRGEGKNAQIRRSVGRQLTIVSVPEYLAYVLEKAAGLHEEIKSLHEQETQAAGQVNVIKTGVTSMPAPK